ncbi:9285_t:CDS:2 [Paraglomus brasilianum]|uniref:9285_t:CDS:1 n=1 Tax=Paraglomus brasilianum TaxID=144538 RepID=A0A9N8VIE1_9GLOM|nr:9285_t:CDS:2 [Paraglomus brasilianum]
MNVEFLLPEAHQNDDDDVEMPDVSDKFVTPGETISVNAQYMRSHGTFSDEKDGIIKSSLAGKVEIVNKLISVRTVHSRYNAEIGDLIVGRITEVAQKRWKVDINSRQDAVLLLSAINLPGGVMRRKTEEDELQMREYFSDGDILAAEVSGTFQDGAASIQTRNHKYGKLKNGSFVSVPPSLVQRCKTHFHVLSCGVDVVLGLNGYIWVCKHTPPLQDVDLEAIYSNENEPISDTTRESIARVCNCITSLARKFMIINDSSITLAYEASFETQNVD